MAKKNKKKKSSKKKSVPSTVSSKPRINGAKKGKQFERDVANAIGHIFPAAERMLEYQASGNVGIDIQGTGNFKIQCKRNAGYAPISRIFEVRSKDQNDIPILITKGNKMDAMAVLPFKDFIYMMEVMHGMEPLLKKYDDDNDKTIVNESEVVEEYKMEPEAKIFDFIGEDVGVFNTALIPVAAQTLEVTSEFSEKLGIKGKAKELHTVTNTKVTLQGHTILEDNELCDLELIVNGTVHGSEANRLLVLGIQEDDIPEAQLQHHIHKCVKSGMVIKGIHCRSISELKKLFVNTFGPEYPVETSSVQTSIASLSDLI